MGTPLPLYVKLNQKDCSKSDGEKAEMAKVPYASAICNLMYAMIATRLGIAFNVSRYMANPGKKHWEAVKALMCYL